MSEIGTPAPNGTGPMPAGVSRLDAVPLVRAPDGAEVRLLNQLAGGGLAQFALAPGRVSRAVTHRTVEEIWFVSAGRGRLWRRLGAAEAFIELGPGVCVALPLGAAFQFRNDGAGRLEILAVTMPPWPGADEAVAVSGPWAPRL